MAAAAAKPAAAANAAFGSRRVISIDIGTSRAGYAFASRASEVVCEQSDTMKDLTAVLLNPDLSLVAFGAAARKAYLHSDLKQQRELLYFERFKMCLYGDVKVRPQIKAANGKSVAAVDVFAAALKHFKTEALKRVNAASAGVSVADTEVQWVVTVPAIWDDGAKQVMREAAKKAGLWDQNESQLLLALESEAASLYCRQREMKANAEQWQAGMRYAVADLGGGTADFTCHKVTDAQTLGQVIESSGGPWGSEFVDREFMRLLDQIFGDKTMTTWKQKFPAEDVELMQDFEAVKVTMTCAEQKPQRIRLPLGLMQHVEEKTGHSVDTLCAQFAAKQSDQKDGADWKDHFGCVRGQLKLPAATVRQFFDPVVRETTAHLKNVLCGVDGISFVFVAGGFAESDIMQNALKSALKPLGIRVVKPPHSALAVLSGAVLFGLNPRNMHVRIAKHTYAESVLNQYDAGIHAGRPVITVIQNGQPVQRVCVLKTFVSRGDELPVGFAVTIHGTPAHDGQTAVVSELYR